MATLSSDSENHTVDHTERVLATLSLIGPLELSKPEVALKHLNNITEIVWAKLCEQHHGFKPHQDGNCKEKYLGIWCLQRAYYYLTTELEQDQDLARAQFYFVCAEQILVSYTKATAHQFDQYWACYHLGKYYLTVAHDERLVIGKQLIQQAANLNHPDAHFILATHYANEMDRNQRLLILKRAAEANHPNALMTIAKLYDSNTKDIEIEVDANLIRQQKSNDQLSVEVNQEISLRYIRKALASYEQAVLNGDYTVIDQYLSWQMYPEEEREYQRLNLLKIAAKSHHHCPEVALELFQAYSKTQQANKTSQVSNEHMQQSLEYLEQAAVLGSICANNILAEYYAYGFGDLIAKDSAKACLHLHRSSKLSDESACRLALMYLQGDDNYNIKININQAEKMFDYAYALAKIYKRTEKTVNMILTIYTDLNSDISTAEPYSGNMEVITSWKIRGAIEGSATFAAQCAELCQKHSYLANHWRELEKKLLASEGRIDALLSQELYQLGQETLHCLNISNQSGTSEQAISRR